MKQELTNRQYKEVKALIERSGARKKSGLLTGEGERFFREIPEELIETVIVSESYLAGHPQISAFVLDDAAYRKLCDTQHPQGIMAVFRQPSYDMADISGRGEDEGMYILIEGIQDPGNLGTIIRTAEAAGVKGIIMDRKTADVFSPKTVRATMGSIFRVPFAYTDDLAESMRRMKENGVVIYGAHLKGEDLYENPPAKKRAYLIGNEGRGISKEAAGLCDKKIRIPMQGKVESLNAAVAAAILMFNR